MEHESADETRGRPSPEYSDQRNPPGDRASVLSRIARELDAERTLNETIGALVTAAVEAIPGADEGGITEVCGRGRQVDTVFATDQLAKDLDNAQYGLGQGPCLESANSHRTVRVDNFESDPRWPAFAARARESGVKSSLSVQLYVQDDDLGALNMYARQPNAFNDESEQAALAFAAHASIALSAAQREEQLHLAVGSRDTIGQAKGILMERYKITAEQAFAVLTQASSETNRKLREVAEALTTTGEIPELRCPPHRLRDQELPP